MHDVPEVKSLRIAQLFVFGGWVNPTAYFFRAIGIDAFVFGGSWKQILSATIAGVSAASIALGWGMIARGMYVQHSKHA